MNEVTFEQAIAEYTKIYERMYQRKPSDMKVIDHQWIIVNSARLSLTDLQRLTVELRSEYNDRIASKRVATKRLVAWFSQ